MPEDGPALRRRRLGFRLRALREERGMTGEAAGRAIDRSASWISRVETGRMTVRVRELRDLLNVYDVRDADVREQFEELVTGHRQQGWWSKYRTVVPEPYATLIGLEAEATVIRTYENSVFPGLVQTREYAEAIFQNNGLNWDEQGIRDRTAVRIARQKILHAPDAPRLSIVIEESVINQTVGSQDIMVRQLDSVARVAIEPAVELLIVPYQQARPAISVVGFVVLSFATADRPVVYVENPSGGSIEEATAVATYEQLFERLRALAAGPQESIDMILHARDRLIRRTTTQ
jgi:transcriptional regulator with XRE-family HTH domain